MKIFVTGIAGFLGSHLAERLVKMGHEVAGVDNLIGGDMANVPAGTKFWKADCNDRDAMLAALDHLGCSDGARKKVDVVYHCAATAHEGLSVFSPHTITQNIVTATTGVLSAAISQWVGRFVYCSSMSRYGAQEVPFVETMKPEPQDPYAIGKVCAEEMVKLLCNVHNMEWVIVVPHNVIGDRQRFCDPHRNVASIMANLMLQGRRPFIYGDGRQKRCFSFVGDVVDPLVQLAMRPEVVGGLWRTRGDNEHSRGVWNVGPDDNFITINELFCELAAIIGFDGEPIYMPGRPQEVMLANCSADKARTHLGYAPKTTLRDGLRSIVDHIREKGPKPFEYNLPVEIVNEKTPETWAKRLFLLGETQWQAKRRSSKASPRSKKRRGSTASSTGPRLADRSRSG